ncbi:class I SAM-dependent DNA methyltransferase [Roseomonas sp. CCTCC AB2023176]|uniref:class I SAM-dependent DNA methyltransferase n=1 Tax=Roseomonas sp. CCTCC AB2023176 TaxID=3342640 RepID=UPI0035E26232
MTDPVARDYDALASQYARQLGGELAHKPFDRDWLSAFARRMAGRGPVADLGCGPGHVTAFLAAQGVEVVGIDLSPGMIGQARGAHPGLAFEVAEMRDLGADPGRFAGAVAAYALIHFDDDAMRMALAAIRTALRPDGELIAAVHLGEGVLRPGAMWGVSVGLGFRMFGPGELDASLAAAGFEVLESVARDPYPDVEYPSRRAYLRARVTPGPC